MKIYQNSDGTTNLASVNARIDALGALSDARIKATSATIVSVVGGAGMAFLNPDEASELHELKMMLPTYSQLRKEAAERLAARLSDPTKKRGRAAIHDRPLADKHLTSYRCSSPYGYIMIGATDTSSAWNEALRSSAAAKRETLQVWNGSEYVDC